MRTFTGFLLCALFLAPVAASADFDNTVPWRNLSGNSPVLLTRTSTWFNNDGSIRLCVSFRNVSDKAASRVRVAFQFVDSFDRPMRDAVIERSGSFGSGILIEGKMDLLGGNSDSFNNCVDNVTGTSTKPTLEKIDVTDVIFEDGTRWKKGDPFVRAFDNGGNRITPTPVGVATTAPGTAPAVNIGGATAVGGSVAASGAAFGTIAWIPGSRTAYGVSTDATSQSDADFAAMLACTQLAKGATGCKPVVRLFGADNKCGAIATDEVKYSTGRGPNMSATIQSVLQALAAAGGTIAGNSVIASACNTRT